MDGLTIGIILLVIVAAVICFVFLSFLAEGMGH